MALMLKKEGVHDDAEHGGGHQRRGETGGTDPRQTAKGGAEEGAALRRA